MTISHEDRRAPTRSAALRRGPSARRGQARPHPRDVDAALRGARLPRDAHRGHRDGALDRQGLGLPALRQQGRPLPRGLPEGRRRPSRRTSTRRRRSSAKGFFATLRYWLERTDRLVRENWIPYRIALLGNYGTDLKAAQRDQPLPPRPGPVRHGRLRAHRRRARRGAPRHRRGDDRLACSSGRSSGSRTRC